MSQGWLTLAYYFGRLDGAVHFADASHRAMVAQARVAAAWRAFRRDAGAGDTGIAHAGSHDAASILLTDDPRRDAVVLWLADHGTPAIAAAAGAVARMVDAQRRFAPDAMALIETTQAALRAGKTRGELAGATDLPDPSGDDQLHMVRAAIGAIDTLIDDPDFAEAQGYEASIDLPVGALHHHVTAAPAGCWALNLALLGERVADRPCVAGAIPRAVFRRDLDAGERADFLCDHWTRAGRESVLCVEQTHRRYARGTAALSDRSRNARVRDAWALIVALGPLRRIHVARALGLTRAGADIQAHALARARLVTLEIGGRMQPTRSSAISRMPTRLDDLALAVATEDLDASLALVDRLLATSPTCVPRPASYAAAAAIKYGDGR
ncbi:MAG: hypothetical protein ABW039_10135 [Sphingobium sp.]